MIKCDKTGNQRRSNFWLCVSFFLSHMLFNLQIGHAIISAVFCELNYAFAHYYIPYTNLNSWRKCVWRLFYFTFHKFFCPQTIEMPYWEIKTLHAKIERWRDQNLDFNEFDSFFFFFKFSSWKLFKQIICGKL